MEIADIVISANGRDAGKRFIVIEIQEQYSLIADGKGRRYEKPKKKKHKHLRYEGKASGVIAEKLIKGERVTNNELRRMLAAYAGTHADKKAKPETKGGAPKCPKTI